MSNNASMDYRGLNILGGTQQILPDPYDEINVKTLNIVDDDNQPYYTFPREENLIGGDGAVAVFKNDGTSSLQVYTEPAYFYMSNSNGGADIDSRGNVNFDIDLINSLYNITRVDDLSLRMPKGTYLCNVNFAPSISSTPNNTPRSNMYFSIDGSTDTNAPFYFVKTYSTNQEFVTFTQIINVESPTQLISLKVDNRNNTASDIVITTCNVSISKIAPNLRTNIIPFFGEFYANINYLTDAYFNDLTTLPKRTYNMPYSLINRENETDNTTIKQFIDPDWGDYNALKLIGSPSSSNFYTLQFSGTIAFSCNNVELKELKVFFQQSIDGVRWTNLDTATTIYTNTSTDTNTFINPIPISLTKYNYLPRTRVENSYVRVMIQAIPDNNVGNFINTNIYFNDVEVNGVNSYFSIFPTTSPIVGQALYNVDMRGNGYSSILNRGYSILKRPLGSVRPTPTIEGVALIGINSFFLLPLVINNRTPIGNDSISNVKMVYRQNNFQNFFGSSLCELQFLTTLTNYPITVRFNARFNTSQGSFCNIRWYLNDISMFSTNLLISGSPVIPANSTFDQTFTVTFPEITANSTLFGIFQFLGNNDDTATLEVLDDNYIKFGY